MEQYLQKTFIPLIIIVISWAALLVVRSVLLGLLSKRAKERVTHFDELAIATLRAPSFYWCIATGLYIGVAVSELNPKYVFYITKTIHVLVILSVTVAFANLSGRLFRNYVNRSNLPIPTTGLVDGIIKWSILMIGFLIILSVFGISIAPLITALGVGGLAVALALQDTLANLFSGMHILVERTIRIGDFIRLESGQEGYVEDITWRTTRIRMLPNNMVVIPNHKLAQSIVTNYYLPDKKLGSSITVSVSYSSDPDKVIRVLTDEAKKAVGDVPGLLGDPEPSAQLAPGFGENSLNFTLGFQVDEYTRQYLVQHELRKRILKRFQAEGIEIPFPQRTVHLRQEQPPQQ